MPIFDNPSKGEAYKYGRRWAAVIAVGAAAILAGGPALRSTFDSIAYSNGVADKLAQPFVKDQRAIDAGRFASGSVIEVPLISSNPSEDASSIGYGDQYQSQLNDIKNDIVAEAGEDPAAGKEVYLARDEVSNPPVNSVAIK